MFIVILAFSIVLGNNITKVRANTKTIENVDDDITKQYVILTDSRHTYNTVVAEYDDLAEESENSTNLEEQSIVVADLTEEEAEQLSSEEGIVCIEEDYVMKGSSEEDYIVKGLSEENDNIKTEWNIDMVNGDDCDSDSLETVKVAVIDSGIDYTDGIDVKVRKNFIPGQDDTNILYEDIAGHGTGIAGIISAAQNDDNYLNGITSNVELYSARVLDGNNTSPVSRVVNGIYWAIEKGVNIINLSMGLQQKSFILEKAIKDAYNEGILIIAAVGNDENAGVEYPAAYDEVMGVASVDSNGIHSNYSATGLEVEISAPGELVKTASCFDGEIIASGTSLAVPHVVGVAAMLWGRDLSKSNEFIRQLINATAKEAGGKEEYGYGIVDAGYAMETYDLFAEAYTERKTVEDITKEIGENEIPIEIFDSDDYIEGRWSTDVHEEYAGLGDISGAELTLLKKAACISDNYNNKDLLGLAHMYQNPQFHGFFDKNNPNDYTNYIACYIMLTKMAKSFSMGNYSSPSQFNGLSSKDYVALTKNTSSSLIYGHNWETILNSLNAKVNHRNKALVFYGLALHTLTDTFAHSAYVNGSLITHNNGNADDTAYFANRVTCAKVVAKNMLFHCSRNDEGSLSDYIIPTNKYNGVFKLKQFSKFAKNVNMSIYQSCSTIFDNMNQE